MPNSNSTETGTTDGHEVTKQHNEETETRGMKHCFGRTRILVFLLSLLCLTLLYSNQIALNFTVICMDDVIDEQTVTNSTQKHWLQSPSKISYLFSAIAVGAMAGIVPMVPCMEKLEIRLTMTMYLLLSAVCTLAMPLSIQFGYFAILVVRFFVGFAASIGLSGLGAIAERWSPMAELGTTIAVLSTFHQLGPIFTMPMSAFFCSSSFGWRSIYYLQGILTLFFGTLFFAFFRNTPEKHKLVSRGEIRRINSNRVPRKKGNIPYMEICKDVRIVSIWLAITGGNLAFTVLLFYGPTYMNKVLGLDINSTGWATAMPYVLSAFVKFSIGPISDRTNCCSEKNKLLFFTGVSRMVLLISLMTIALTDSAILARTFYTAAIAFMGVNIMGTIKAAQLISRQYVSFVMAVTTWFACISQLLIPLVVSIMCPDNTSEQWSRFYIYCCVAILLTNIPFFIYGDDKPAAYTLPDWEKKKSSNFAVIVPESGKISVLETGDKVFKPTAIIITHDSFSVQQEKKKIEELL